MARRSFKSLIKKINVYHIRYRYVVFALTLAFSFYMAKQGDHLPISLSLSKLLPDDRPSVRDMRSVIKEVGGAGHFIVLLGPMDSPESELPDLSARLKKLKEVKYLFYERETYLMESKALYFLKKREFKKLKKHARALFNDGDTSMLNFGLSNSETQLKKIVAAKKYFKDFKNDTNTDRYYLSKDKKYAMLLIKPIFDSTDLKRSEKLANQTSIIIKKTLGENAKFELLGRYIEKVHNKNQFEKDIAKTAIISFVLLTLVLIWGLGTIRAAIVTNLGTVIALGITLGIAKFAVGQINILTAFLLAILGGLGAEYGIHLIRCFYQKISEGKTKDQAIFTTYIKMGRALFSAAITSSCAFFILKVSDFRGFSELGIIAGGGIVAIYLVYILCFPAIGKLLRPQPRFKKALEIFGYYPVNKSWIWILIPIIPLSIWGIAQAEFEYNFQRMQDLSKKTVHLNSLSRELFGKALTPSALLVDNQKEALAVTNWLGNQENESVIQEVISLPLIVPPKMKSRHRQLKKLAKMIKDTPDDELEEKTGIKARKIRSWLNQKPYTKDDLPIQVKSIFGKSGNIVLVYPENEQTNAKAIEDYSNVLLTAQKMYKGLKVGSDTLVFTEIINHITKDGKVVMLLFLLGALFVFWLDFRNLRLAIALELQLVFGIYLLVALMGALGIRFTILNVAMIPAVLAAGVDMGVHILHKELEGLKPLASARHIAQAVQLSVVTTMIGFGSLFFAQASMLKGIAAISVLGQISMYLVCMIISPVVKEWYQNVFRIKYEIDENQAPSPKA